MAERGAKRVAWGITGSGDKLAEIVEIMKEMKKRFGCKADIRVYLSKAGEQVLKYYRMREDLEKSFEHVSVEVDSNSPFLAGALQLGKFEFLIIAPATSNTVAKISVGIADTLLCNAAIMALKAFLNVYILPSDYNEGLVVTKLPSGRDLKLRVRKEDVTNTRKLVDMDGVYVLAKPHDILKIFIKHFG